MKKKLLRQLASIEKALKEHFSNDLSDSFKDIKNAINSLVEEEKSDQASFAIPMDIMGVDNAYVLYSDGACRGNPGPGAYGCLVQDSNSKIVFEYAETKDQTTNNQMELQGVISGISLIKNKQQLDLSSIQLTVVTDSKYVVDGITKWVSGWKKRGWKKADNKTPENLELWQTLDSLVQEVGKINFEWVKGHAGHPQNEYCDQLANQALDNEGF